MLAPVRLKKLCHTLRNGAPAAERLRRLPDRSLAALTQAGIFRSLVPRCYGGTEIPLSLLFETLLEAGRCCCSSAWVGSLLAVHSVIAAWFTEKAQARVWPTVRTP